MFGADLKLWLCEVPPKMVKPSSSVSTGVTEGCGSCGVAGFLLRPNSLETIIGMEMKSYLSGENRENIFTQGHWKHKKLQQLKH